MRGMSGRLRVSTVFCFLVFWPMTWTAHKNIIAPQARWFDKTHCMLPTPEHLEGSKYRIYYGGRNDKNQSHIACADINLDTLEVNYAAEPVLSLGALGCFDDNGVLPSCITPDALYYIGFKPGGTTRMQLLYGVALREDGSVSRLGDHPQGCNTIGIETAPWLLDGRYYTVNGIEWLDPDTPRYDIRVNLRTAIPLAANENALARPYVVKEDGIYKMFFSAKGKDEFYRPQYAESHDGYEWERKPYDFPEDHMCYAIVLKHGEKEFMFYNDASNYGRNGINLAVR